MTGRPSSGAPITLIPQNGPRIPADGVLPRRPPGRGTAGPPASHPPERRRPPPAPPGRGRARDRLRGPGTPAAVPSVEVTERLSGCPLRTGRPRDGRVGGAMPTLLLRRSGRGWSRLSAALAAAVRAVSRRAAARPWPAKPAAGPAGALLRTPAGRIPRVRMRARSEPARWADRRGPRRTPRLRRARRRTPVARGPGPSRVRPRRGRTRCGPDPPRPRGGAYAPPPPRLRPPADPRRAARGRTARRPAPPGRAVAGRPGGTPRPGRPHHRPAGRPAPHGGGRHDAHRGVRALPGPRDEPPHRLRRGRLAGPAGAAAPRGRRPPRPPLDTRRAEPRRGPAPRSADRGGPGRRGALRDRRGPGGGARTRRPAGRKAGRRAPGRAGPRWWPPRWTATGPGCAVRSTWIGCGPCTGPTWPHAAATPCARSPSPRRWSGPAGRTAPPGPC